jgi:hypothetical protein
MASEIKNKKNTDILQATHTIQDPGGSRWTITILAHLLCKSLTAEANHTIYTSYLGLLNLLKIAPVIG